MPARLMERKVGKLIDYLKEQKEPSNRIDHLLANQHHLMVKEVVVETMDKEDYKLPFEFVFIFKGKNDKNKKIR